MIDMQLEEMRRQMAILKEKLDKQEIVNDQLMRKAIGKKLRRVRNMRWRNLVIMLVGIIYTPILFYQLHIKLWFTILTILFFVTGTVYDLYYTSGLNDRNLEDKHLLELKENVIRMKRRNARWLWFGIPFTLAWLCTLFWLIINKATVPSGQAYSIIIGALVGGSIGAVLGTIVYRRQQQDVKELIDDIEELTK